MTRRIKLDIILLAIIFVLTLFTPINVIAMEKEDSYRHIYNYDDFDSKSLIVKVDKQINFTDYGVNNFIYIDNEIAILNFESIEETISCYDELNGEEYIDFVEPNMALVLSEDETVDNTETVDSKYNSWGIEHLAIDKYATYIKEQNKEDIVTIAVIDSGIDYNHEIFKDKLFDSGYDFINNDNDPYDDNFKGHGTHVAGIIADATRDISNIKIMPIKALNSIGVGTVLSVGNSIKYATNSGVDIINLSLGFKSGVHSKFIEDAILDAIEAGVTVVIAAGNDNLNTINSCPAHINEAIIVSSIDSNNNKADTSNYGNNIDITAPGVNIYSASPGGGYVYKNGTSMAAPHISAIAAILKLNNSELKPVEIENLIKEYSIDIGEEGVDCYFGVGVPDMALALPNTNLENVNLDNSNKQKLKEDSAKKEELIDKEETTEKEDIKYNTKKSVELLYLDNYYKKEDVEGINNYIVNESNMHNLDYYNNEWESISEDSNKEIIEYADNNANIVENEVSNYKISENILEGKNYDNRIFISIALLLIIIIFVKNKLYKRVRKNI